jgi:hypothetical protein
VRERKGRAITASQVNAWFRSSFRKGPLPNRTACERVATALEFQRKALAVAAKLPRSSPHKPNLARTAAINLLAALPERRQHWESAKPLPLTLRASDGELAEISGSKLVANAERKLDALQAALEDAMPYLDHPRAVITKHHHKNEHGIMLHIAYAAAQALHCSGRHALGTETESPLVDFIVAALEGMGQPVPPHATIATALHRIPAMNWVKRQMAIPPQT